MFVPDRLEITAEEEEVCRLLETGVGGEDGAVD
jgi:hypothetical protein